MIEPDECFGELPLFANEPFAAQPLRKRHLFILE